MRLDPHVAHSEHETQIPVPTTNDGVFAEYQCLTTLFRPRHFCEHDAHHECLWAEHVTRLSQVRRTIAAVTTAAVLSTIYLLICTPAGQ